jgi:SOS-response transcriptional repressor LexA
MAKHQGEFLRSLVARSGLSVSEFSRRVGSSREHITRKWFKQEKIQMYESKMWRVLGALGIDEELRKAGYSLRAETPPGNYDIAGVLQEKYGVDWIFDKLIEWDSKGALIPDTKTQQVSVDASFNDRSVEPYSEQPVPGEVPTFEMSVAAGPWADVTDVAEVFEPGQIDHGFFRVRIAGESMKPEYTSGMVVEFQCLREGRDKLIRGRDYYVQKRDGTATFKRLKEIHEDRLVFHALNQRVCKGPMEVLRSEITRMAIARGEYRAFD